MVQDIFLPTLNTCWPPLLKSVVAFPKVRLAPCDNSGDLIFRACLLSPGDSDGQFESKKIFVKSFFLKP